MAHKPKALIFDVFGSLVDWRTGVAGYCKPFFEAKSVNIDPFTFADQWRARYQPAMNKIRSGNRGYIPLEILHRENLDYVLEINGLSSKFEKDERDAMNRAWEHLPAWSDVPPALSALRKTVFIAPCSNGSTALMVRLARFANLPWDTILGADIARDYKPKPEVYLASCRILDIKPHEIMMVAAHNSDLEAAKKAGLMTGFFPRPTEHGADQKTDIGPTGDWDFTGHNMTDLTAYMGRKIT